jgi:lipid A ethanolaminephosphotransferase
MRGLATRSQVTSGVSIKDDSVLVLHQIGSHGPSYFQRYPDAFRGFTPDGTRQLHRDEIVNACDNIVLYTNHVLSTIIDKLKNREDGWRFDD